MLLISVLKLSFCQAREHGVRSSFEGFGVLGMSQGAAAAPHVEVKRKKLRERLLTLFKWVFAAPVADGGQRRVRSVLNSQHIEGTHWSQHRKCCGQSNLPAPHHMPRKESRAIYYASESPSS